MSGAGPRYWMDETTGVVRGAVMAYLAGGPLPLEHVAALRAYFRQWIGNPHWDRNPFPSGANSAQLADLRRRIDTLVDRHSIRLWLDDVEEFGADPL